MIKRFKIHEATDLNLSDAVLLPEDLIEVQTGNIIEREKLPETRRRAPFLPHCSRKFMDRRCKATSDPNIPSYVCAHSSPDCLKAERCPLLNRRTMIFIHYPLVPASQKSWITTTMKEP